MRLHGPRLANRRSCPPGVPNRPQAGATSPSTVGVGTSSTGMSGGAPNATAAFENAIAVVTVAVSSTSSAGLNSASERRAQLVVDALRVDDQRVGVADRQLPAVGEVARGEAVLDLVDRVLGEPGGAGAGEAEVPADPAPGDPGVAQAADLLGRLVDDAVGPERPVVGG